MKLLLHMLRPPEDFFLRLFIIACVLFAVFLLGQIHGERIAGKVHLDYISEQAVKSVRIARAQEKVMTQIQTKYVDRIQKIYIEREKNEEQIQQFISPDDRDACVIRLGFVRLQNAAWTGRPTGSAAESDREPAGLSIADVAKTDNHNAASCRIWREQALGLREFYLEQQKVMAGNE